MQNSASNLVLISTPGAPESEAKLPGSPLHFEPQSALGTNVAWYCDTDYGGGGGGRANRKGV